MNGDYADAIELHSQIIAFHDEVRELNLRSCSSKIVHNIIIQLHAADEWSMDNAIRRSMKNHDE